MVVMWLLGMNPLDLLTGGGQFGGPQQRQTVETGQPGAAGDDVRRTSSPAFSARRSASGRSNSPNRGPICVATLVLFSDSTQSACGLGPRRWDRSTAPGDSTIYIDLSFFRDLENRLGAPGDFAQAYVIAHEVGHHVQNLLGTLGQITRERARLPEAEANEVSVRVELQADCYAGIWAHAIAEAGTILEEGDIEEGLNAASAIGDDRLQRQTQGRVVPESFTHGTSEQRVRWFRRGMETGELAACDTFRADRL
jgi:uncharacterized protein